MKRRLSFLDINNFEQSFELKQNNKSVKLYSKEELINRPAEEIIRQKINQRSDDDKPGRIEKDFQTFLFGKGIDRNDRTNERLAILGEDFYNLQRKNLGVLREFPTGVFFERILKKNRILPTEFIDIVTLNKWEKLSIIELKVNDPSLEVIAQLIDYALYFTCYQKELKNVIERNSKIRIQDSYEFICYVVNNHFHDRFDQVIQYYSPKYFKFKIRKITLGYTEIIG